VSQSQCGRPTSQSGYASSPWWAVTRTNQLIRNRPLPDRRTFEAPPMREGHVIRYYPPFRAAIPESGAR
jgi:hypothetical protein